MADTAAQQKEVESTVEETSEVTKKAVAVEDGAEENGDRDYKTAAAAENGSGEAETVEAEDPAEEDESNDSAQNECSLKPAQEAAQKRKSGGGADAPDGTTEGATPEKKAKLSKDAEETTAEAESNGKVEVTA